MCQMDEMNGMGEAEMGAAKMNAASLPASLRDIHIRMIEEFCKKSGDFHNPTVLLLNIK